MSDGPRHYLPAAGRDWALPLYDPVVALLGGARSRRMLIDQASLGHADRALEIGCGTGTLLVAIKRAHPGVEVVGLDPDPAALAVARRKAARAGISIALDRGFADALPYADASFDRVFSSFMLHHVPKGEKDAALREVRRVLKGGGSLHLVDFAGDRKSGRLARLLHPDQALRDGAEDRVVALMAHAGLVEPRHVASGAMLFGLMRMNYYRAAAPAGHADRSAARSP